MKWKMKRLLGLFLSLALVLGLFPGMSMTAYAASINAFGGQSVTISSDQTCTSFDVLDGSTLTVNQGVTLTLNMNDGHSFNLFDNSNLELHGTLAGSVGSGATWMDNTYINVYLSDGAKYTVTGLSCMDGDNYLRYYGYDAATDGNGTVSVMNGTTDVTASSIGYKTTTYTFTATPSSGYRFVSWTKGASGEVLGTDASINVTCEQNGQYQVYANFEVAHTHSFTYSASGDTITATCSVANCTLTDSKATLTIAAPALTTYGGTGDATATLTGLSDFNTATGKTIAATDIKYVGRDSTTYEESTTAPTDAGKYTAKITVEDKTASVDYEIAKADPTATAPTATATYGQTLADVTLNNPDGNTAGTWAWVDSTTSVGTVGEHTFKANFTPTDTTNYNSKSNVDVTVTVGKAANPATVTSTASVTKGGNTVDLANNVTKNGATGAVSYEISGEANGCSLNGSVLTSGSNTGSVTVNVTIAEDSNYNALAATPITVTISNKGTQTISAENVTATYGDTDKSVSATVTDPATGGGDISYAVKEGSGDYIDVDATTGALTIKKVPADGKAYVTVTAAETATYAQATKEVTVTINKANAVAATVTANNRTYDGTEKPLVTVTGTPTGGTMQYALGENATTAPADNLYTTSIPAKTDVGTYYVWYKAKGDSSHADSDAGYVIAEIKKSEGGGTPSANTLVYSGSAQALVTAGKAEGGTMQYALGENADTAPEASAFTASIPTGVDAKTYYVWYMVKGDENHNDTKPACVEATIAKKGLTVTADAKSKTQGEADPALTYTVEGLVGSDTLTGALSREAGEDPGTYAITQGTLTAGDNYEITFTSAVLTINKKDEPAPAPSGGGGVYYGGGTVSSQPQAPYSQVIGATATSYGDSSPERIHNIELACEKLDGIVLQPGEVFSFNEAVGALTADAGFEIAPVYPGDEATAVMGGGVSQVASTLYASSLFGLLETVERSNHEYAVPFAQAGVDADVSNPAEGGGLDLKFRNSRSEPIKIVVTSKVDEAKQIREITVELRSVLAGSDYMPVRFDNSKSGEKDGVLFADVLDPTRPGYRIVLDHEEQSFTDANGSGIRTLTHRKILDAGGWLVKDEILNARLPDGSYAMDTYYTKG